MDRQEEKISKLESKVNQLETKLASIENQLELYRKLIIKLDNDYEDRLKKKREGTGNSQFGYY